MFKLNEEIIIKAVVIKIGYEFDTMKRVVVLEPFLYVSPNDYEWDPIECFEVDFFGLEIGEDMETFENQEQIIANKIQEGKENLKKEKLRYSLKSIKRMINGEKIKTAGNHEIAYCESKIKYFINKHGDLDIEYFSGTERIIG
jgi:hypothetical protein